MDQPGSRYAVSLAFQLSQVGARSAELFADQLRPLGLSPRAFAVLSSLDGSEGQTQQQLCDALGIHRNNMVALIDEIEAGGWARRHRSEQDRRAFNIMLTDTGRALLARVQDTIAALEQTVARDLSAEEHATMVALLRRVADTLDLVPGVHPSLYKGAR